MEFKKNWGIIWQIRMLMILCFALCSIFSITFFWCEEYRLAHSLMLSGLLMILLLYCAMLVLPGFLSEMVKISEKGVSLHHAQNGESFFAWGEIQKITQSRKFGTNIFILLNNSGEEMWFYSSKKIKKYMIAVYPPIESLFV